MHRHAPVLLPIAVVALAAAGCGQPAAVLVRDRTVRIVETEYRLTPQNVTVHAGRVTFVAINHGRLIHNLAIEPIPDDPDDVVVPIKKSETLHPGETSAPFSVTLRPGKYRLLCTIANHDDLGQYGTLYVER